MHPQLRNINARKFKKALQKDGFVFIYQKGGHKSYFKNNYLVTVSFHRSSDHFRRKTLKSMIKQAGWTEKYLVYLLN